MSVRTNLEVARLEPRPHPGVARTIPVPPQASVFGLALGRAALGWADGRVRVVDLATGITLLDGRCGDGDDDDGVEVRDLTLAGRWLVVAAGDRVEVWDTIRAARVGVHPPHPAPIEAVAVDPERRWVATLDARSPGVRVASLRTGEPVATIGRIVVPERPGAPTTGAAELLRRRWQQMAALQAQFAPFGAADEDTEQALHELVRQAWLGRPVPRLALSAGNVAGWGALDQRVAGVLLGRAAADLADAVRALGPEDRPLVRPTLGALCHAIPDLDRLPDDLGCVGIAWTGDGELVIDHDGEIGVWSIDGERRRTLSGRLHGAVGNTIVATLPNPSGTGHVAAWFEGDEEPKEVALPNGRLLPLTDPAEELIVVDDASATLMRGGLSERIPAGLGRLGAAVGRLGDDLVVASRTALHVCPLAELAVEEPRSGLPIRAIAVHPAGRWVALVRMLDDAHATRVELWYPESRAVTMLPGEVPFVDGLGTGPGGHVWAGGDGGRVRIWHESRVEPEIRPGVLVDPAWTRAGDELRHVESGAVRPCPPLSPGAKLLVRPDETIAVTAVGIEVWSADVTEQLRYDAWPSRPVRVARGSPSGAVVVVFEDGGVASWSAEGGVEEPWGLEGVVDVAITSDERLLFAVIDEAPDDRSHEARAWVELWDGAVRIEMWPCPGPEVVVAAAGPWAAFGRLDGSIVLLGP